MRNTLTCQIFEHIIGETKCFSGVWTKEKEQLAAIAADNAVRLADILITRLNQPKDLSDWCMVCGVWDCQEHSKETKPKKPIEEIAKETNPRFGRLT